jgi:3-hydroxyacyl-[acyl-carrier-protein] dehydratase
VTSVVKAPVRIVRPVRAEGAGWVAETAVDIDATEPVFAGHYPDFPIFPGVCVVDSVHRGALATVPGQSGTVTLAAVESARFLGAVHPGDVLRVELSWRSVGSDWLCAAKASTGRGEAATVRLRYRAGDAS